ncbi:hypothetical protein ACQV5M_20645, partial [Leptospira sp. SA-E8]|uniref:hypothetical protein n=1 Tax=Leptospira sp. SA-E8 TaxID=3422259 RepID=UPI003EB9646F
MQKRLPVLNVRRFARRFHVDLCGKKARAFASRRKFGVRRAQAIRQRGACKVGSVESAPYVVRQKRAASDPLSRAGADAARLGFP